MLIQSQPQMTMQKPVAKGPSFQGENEQKAWNHMASLIADPAKLQDEMSNPASLFNAPGFQDSLIKATPEEVETAIKSNPKAEAKLEAALQFVVSGEFLTQLEQMMPPEVITMANQIQEELPKVMKEVDQQLKSAGTNLNQLLTDALTGAAGGIDSLTAGLNKLVEDAQKKPEAPKE